MIARNSRTLLAGIHPKTLALIVAAAVLGSFSISVAATKAGSADAFSASEASQVDQMINGIRNACEAGAFASIKAKAAANNGGTVPDWAQKLTSPDYCNCTAERVKSAITPNLVRHGSAADGEKLSQGAAQYCAARVYRQSFPGFCHSMLTSLAARTPEGAIPAEQEATACSCMQRRADQTTGENLAATLQATTRDYRNWQRAPNDNLSSDPDSMMGAFLACLTGAGITRQR
jgi:hypothetical protein